MENRNPPVREKRKPGKKPRRPLRKLFYYLFWVFILVMFSGLIASQASRYNELRAELDRVNANVAREQELMEAQTLELTFFDNDAYIERLARERLGMVRPNEIVFRNRTE